MKTVQSTLIAAAIIGAPATAHATESWYGRIDVGYGVAGDAQFNASAPIGGEADLDDAILGSVGAGFAFSNGVRAEAEAASRRHDFGPQPLIDQGGSVAAQTLMFNVYYDFRANASFQPYVGAGFGAARVSVEASNLFPLNPVFIDDDDTVVAYQLIVGVTTRLSPHFDLDLGYRYFSAPSIEGDGSAPPIISFPFEADLTQHALTAGLRWDF